MDMAVTAMAAATRQQIAIPVSPAATARAGTATGVRSVRHVTVTEMVVEAVEMAVMVTVTVMNAATVAKASPGSAKRLIRICVIVSSAG